MTNTSSSACDQAQKGDTMTSIRKTVVVFGGAILLAVSGNAQAAMDTVVKANVPFDFVVNGQTMPAGRYRIERDDLSPSLLLIRGDQKNNHSAVFVLTVQDGREHTADSQPTLTFKHVENKYELTNVWDSQENGLDLVTR